MCGIVGYAGFSSKTSLDKAIHAIKHRGPDDSGSEYFDGVALGNVRLAIIDLSKKGHQPMFNQDKSLCITFNGEIYNYKEVKKLLEHTYEFKSHTDTEVILNAYKEWGVTCLEKLHGMFSFVLYDRKKELLFGARDRLGQKPLKYYFDNGVLIFASEIKGILSLLQKKPAIDETAIDDFLTLQYVPSPKTGFKKIYKLPAGHFFIYQNGIISTQKYWSINFKKKIKLSESEWEDVVYKEIESAVKSHLVSDVPVGALLSGGLDSSIIVALMSKNSVQKINTFSIGFNDDDFDETPFAKTVSQLYKTKHTKFKITSQQLLDNISKITNYYDEPIGDNSILPTLLVCQLTSKKVKVALTGDGGDENFAGYERYSYVSLAQYLSQLPSIGKQFLRFTSNVSHTLVPNKFTERMNRFLSSLEHPFYRKYILYNVFFTTSAKRSLYSDDFKKIIGDNDTYERFKKFYNKDLGDLENALKIDMNTYLPDDLLYKSDTASMANSLELRAPFLDHNLMETVAAMPSEMKLKLFHKKKILKNIAFKKKLLPKEIIYRSKRGFNIPQNKWFKGPLKKYMYQQILTSQMTGDIFDKNKVKNYLDQYYATNLNYDNTIFALLSLSLWYDTYH